MAWHRSNEASRRLDAIPGVGPVLATALVASVPDPKIFRSARDFAAWIGLVPKQNSSGGKERLGGVTKQGDRYLRSLLTIGALAVMGEVGLERADVMGYSMGAGVALQLAIRHSQRVKKLVAISMAFRFDGDYPEIRAAFDTMPAAAAAIGQQIAASPLAAMYPDVDWEVMVRKTGEMNQPAHDLSEGVATIKSPTLIVFADADSIQLDHMMQFYKLLRGGQRDGGMDGSGRSVNQFAIIPNRTHYNLLTSPTVTRRNSCKRNEGSCES